MHTSTDLLNKKLLKHSYFSALFWLLFFPAVGIFIALKFNYPELFADIPWLTFGRVRPIHVNGVVFGSYTTAAWCLSFYFVPKLTKTRLYGEHYACYTIWLWNFTLAAGSISLALGYNQGSEAGEYPLFIDIFVFICFILMNIHILGTIIQRKTKQLYVSLWYLLAAFIWTDLTYILGNFVIPYAIPGINNVILHGLYIHYVVGLWITPFGLALVYYFLPVSSGNPLYSHRLSLIGFWTIAFFYPLVGTHHYLFSPIPDWNETIAIMSSMMLIIPVWTVVANFFGTMAGRWREFAADNYPVKFLITGSFFYLIGSTQGSTEALRSLQEITHFTDYVIGHSHLTVLGAFILFCIAGMYHILPDITGKTLYSKQLASWHYWLTVSGISVMILILTIAGLIQGTMWKIGVEFIDSLGPMKPYWLARTVSGIVILLGLVLFAINSILTITKGETIQNETTDTQPSTVNSLTKKSQPGHLEKTPSIILIAGFGFFLFAMFLMAAIPWIDSSSHSTAIKDISGNIRHSAPYTGKEKQGREVYIREGCFYCHSQYIRPVAFDEMRWGPVSQAAEYVFDQPQLLGTRRIGPDLTRIGGKYADDWHIAHFWNPRIIVPESIMPSFPWLFNGVDEHTIPIPSDDLLALITYLQRLGTQIGDWRRPLLEIARGSEIISPPVNDQLGKRIYARRCAGCHGEKGDGKGEAAKFLTPKPRNFISGIFKFKSSPHSPMPTDGDLYRIITRGVRGTSMPSWRMLQEYERWALVHYLKGFSSNFVEEKTREPLPSKDSSKKGSQLFADYCAMCHGEKGKGDGPLANDLNDIWEEPVRPANLTKPEIWKGGTSPRYLFERIMNGIPGTPMPEFNSMLTKEEIWNIVHYVLSLSNSKLNKEK